MRRRRGTNVKLTESQVLEIRARAQDGMAKIKLARLYGISARQIRRILDGENWVSAKPVGAHLMSDPED